MSVQLDVSVDARDVKRLASLAGKAKVAGAKALTFTAQDAQKQLRSEASSKFHLRRDWVPKGFRIKPATAGTMTAQVGSIDKYMARHVVGEDKAPAQRLSIRRMRDSRGRIATGGLFIPAYGSVSAVMDHRATRRMFSRIESQKRKPFQIQAESGHVMIVRRTSKKRLPLEALAHLTQGADMNPVWRIDATVRGVVGDRFSRHFERALAALAR